MLEKIEKELDERVRPALRNHGGDVQLKEYHEGKVLVRLIGACSGCPESDLATRSFIEEVLKARFPEISEVEIDHSVDPDMMDLAGKILRHEI